MQAAHEMTDLDRQIADAIIVIVSSNAAGFVTGEWTKAGGRAKAYLFAGSVVVLLALGILAMAQRS